jgi:diaminopimelate epimerase
MKGNTEQIKFVKMTGAGNDFILIDNRLNEYQFQWSALAPILCQRRFGVGADGLLIIERGKKTPYRMLYYNADGSYGGMCGNGGRCVGKFLMRRLKTQSLSFEALDYVYKSEVQQNNQILLEMKNPTEFKKNIVIPMNSGNLKGHYINTGAPHSVLFVNDLPTVIEEFLNSRGITEIGRAIRHSDVFQPDGTNVDFVTIKNDNQISMRTYERGVEDETLACGTGAVACAVIASLVHNLQPPITVHTRGGQSLLVNFERRGEVVTNVVLIGSAEEVFEGSVMVDRSTNRIINEQ